MTPTWADVRDEVESLCAAGDTLTPTLGSGLGRLCIWYLTAADADREAARLAIVASESLQRLLWTYSHRQAERVAGPADVAALRAGLAAVSLDNCVTDRRDTLTISDSYGCGPCRPGSTRERTSTRFLNCRRTPRGRGQRATNQCGLCYGGSARNTRSSRGDAGSSPRTLNCHDEIGIGYMRLRRVLQGCVRGRTGRYTGFLRV